ICGFLMLNYSITPEIGIIAGTTCAALLGFVYGKLAVRREGIYFAMITLALAQLAFFFYLQAPFTGGEDGLQGVPRGHLFGLLDLDNNMTMYYFVLAVFIGGFWMIHRTVHSPFGQILKAIRENEPRAISLGYKVEQYKLLAFVLSATLAGLAGSTKALVFQLASLNDVHWFMSGEVVLMTLLGGMGTIWGPVLGAGTVVGMQNLLASGPLSNYIHVVMGVVFVVCVLAFRNGIVGELHKLVKKNF
ncbi:MAG TPA: branched-chain amino acid ABC transporter permease, partial [Motiliproteus sp.]